MIGYVLPGAPTAPETAESDPRARRLSKAGPWQAQPHQDGCLLTWVSPSGPRQVSSFGPSRKTIDGMIYFPPKVMPRPEELIREGMAQRPYASRVQVEVDEELLTLIIEPFFATPKKILENDQTGGFSTVYARKALELMAKINEHQDLTVADVRPELNELCRLAIKHSYRQTDELIADCGWITTASSLDMWRAITDVPKALRNPDSDSSEPSKPAAA